MVVAVVRPNEAEIVDLDALRILGRSSLSRVADFLDANSVDEADTDVPAPRVLGDDFGA